MLMLKMISLRINPLIRLLETSSRFVAPLFRDSYSCVFLSLVLDVTTFTTLQLLSIDP